MGSVKLSVNTDGSVVNYKTYSDFGEATNMESIIIKSIINTKPVDLIYRVMRSYVFVILFYLYIIFVSPPLNIYLIFVFILLIIIGGIFFIKRHKLYLYSIEFSDLGELHIKYLYYRQKKVKIISISELDVWKKAIAFKFKEIIALELKAKDLVITQYPNFFFDGSVWNDTKILEVYNELLELKNNYKTQK